MCPLGSLCLCLMVLLMFLTSKKMMTTERDGTALSVMIRLIM
jgi:hypothetical protein